VQGLDSQRRLAGLQPFPIFEQLIAVQFRPRFDEPTLTARQRACNQFDSINRDDAHVLLVIRVEMRPMMRRTRLRKHPNDDAVESRNFRHDLHFTPT
jgi:hypothetical protein